MSSSDVRKDSPDHAAAIVGSTGLVGSNILDTLLNHNHFENVMAFTRKSLKSRPGETHLRTTVSQDSTQWPSEFSGITPKPKTFFSALGTTKGQAGSFTEQRKIDLDLNLELAKAAQREGVKYYVLISSSGVSSKSFFPYSKTKGLLDQAVQDVGFEKTVLVKPGLIVGTRQDSRPPEYLLRLIANFLGRISGNRLKDFWAQDADVIGRAAVAASLKCLDGSAPPGTTWVVGMKDIIRLGRTEWEDKKAS